MGLFEDIRTTGASFRLNEEALYAEAMREMQAGIRRDGLWGKALAECEMDEKKARALYIRMRVQSLKDEVHVFLAQMKREEKAKGNATPQAPLHTAAPRVSAISRGEWKAVKYRQARVWLTCTVISIVVLSGSMALPLVGSPFQFVIALSLMWVVGQGFWGLGVLIDLAKRTGP